MTNTSGKGEDTTRCHRDKTYLLKCPDPLANLEISYAYLIRSLLMKHRGALLSTARQSKLLLSTQASCFKANSRNQKSDDQKQLSLQHPSNPFPILQSLNPSKNGNSKSTRPHREREANGSLHLTNPRTQLRPTHQSNRLWQ